jgi:hypothetical protein
MFIPGTHSSGPLPADTTPQRAAVGTPEILARPEGAAIAGWEQLTLLLSAGVAGLRAIQVVLDATGQPIAASDLVLYRSAAPSQTGGSDAVPLSHVRQESIGGRFEEDGTFRGTCWRSEATEPPDDDELKWQMTPSEPTAADVAGPADVGGGSLATSTVARPWGAGVSRRSEH